MRCLSLYRRVRILPALFYIAFVLGCAAPEPVRQAVSVPPAKPTAEALREAAIAGREGAVRRILVADRALVNVPDQQGSTALILAAGRSGRPYAIELSQYSECVQTLLEFGADVNSVNVNGITPLLAVVSYPLLPKGVPVTLNGQPFGRYLDQVQMQSLRHILAKGPNINASDRYGRTPLYYAALAGRVEMTRMLLASGADKSVRATDGTTALEIAKKRGHDEIVALLSQ